MNGLATLIAALGAGVGGYAKGKQLKLDREEQQADREIRRQQMQLQLDDAAARKEERDEQRRLKNELRASQQDVTVGATASDGKQYQDADLVSADDREMRAMARQTGMEEPAMRAASGFTAGGQTFADAGAAQQAAGGLNARSEKMKRAGDVLSQHGQIDAAQKYYELAKKAETEGVFEFANAVSATAPMPEKLVDANGAPTTLRTPLDKKTIDTFNKAGGKWRLGEGAMAEHYVVQTPSGMPMTETRILDGEGRVLVENMSQTVMGMQDFKTQYEAKKDAQTLHGQKETRAEQKRHHEKTEERQGRQLDITARHYDRQDELAEKKLGETVRHNRAQEGIASARAKGGGGGSSKKDIEQRIAEVEKVTGKLDPDERKAAALAMSGLGRLVDKPGKGGKSDDKEDDKIDRLADKLVEKRVAENDKMTPAQIAKYHGEVRGALKTEANNAAIVAGLKQELGGKDRTSPEYAENYEKRAKQFNLSPAQLDKLGIPAPARGEAKGAEKMTPQEIERAGKSAAPDKGVGRAVGGRVKDPSAVDEVANPFKKPAAAAGLPK